MLRTRIRGRRGARGRPTRRERARARGRGLEAERVPWAPRRPRTARGHRFPDEPRFLLHLQTRPRSAWGPEPRELAGLRPGTPRGCGSRAGGGGSAIRPSGVVFSLSLSCVWREAGLQPREAKGLGRAGQGGAAPLHPFPPPLPGGRPGAPPSGTAPAGCTAHQLFF